MRHYAGILGKLNFQAPVATGILFLNFLKPQARQLKLEKWLIKTLLA